MMLTRIPRRYRNVGFKLLLIAAFVYIATMMFHSELNLPNLSDKFSLDRPSDAVIDEPIVTAAPQHQHELSEEESGHSEDVEIEHVGDSGDSDYVPEEPPPSDPNAPGEMGKPYKVDNPSPEVKAKIDEGWKNNAYNQYVSDLISLHRSLPDHRDEWCRAPGRYFDC